MDLDRLDTLARSSASARSRRRLLGLLATVPVVGGVSAIFAPEEPAAKERRRRRKQRHKRRKDPGTDKHGNRKKTCRSGSVVQICAGICGSVMTTCGKAVGCGACSCTPACGVCFTCQEGPDPNSPGTCVVDPAQQGETCGEPGQVCRGDGQGETCRTNQPPTALARSVNDTWGKICVPIVLGGTDPDGDALGLQLVRVTGNGRIFVYAADQPDFLGPLMTIGQPPLPAEPGTGQVRVCYRPNSRFFSGFDSFSYRAVDHYGAVSSSAVVDIVIVES